MTDQRVPIPFNTTMTADKRNADGCYLRRNIYPKETGLYPAVDFHEDSHNATFPTGSTIAKIHEDLIFVQHNSDLKIYSSSNYPNGPYTLVTTLTGNTYYASVLGNDSLHVLARNGATMNVFKVDFGGNATNIGTVGATATTAEAVFDGVFYFYFINDSIYRQLKSTAMVSVFTGTGGVPYKASVIGEQIALFYDDGLNAKVLFWDKTNATLFTKAITERNCRLLGGGAVNGTLLLIKSIGNSSNNKERIGEISVCAYDGEKFIAQNSIKSGSVQLLKNRQSIANEVMYLAISGNSNDNNTTLYHNFILKISARGEIEVAYQPPSSATQYDITALDVQYNYLAIANRGTDYPRYMHNVDPSNGYDSYTYFTQASYITNFLNNAYNRHKLDGFGISFEKLFDSGASQEVCSIYYRLSERDPFSLLNTVTATDVSKVDTNIAEAERLEELNNDAKGLSHQIYTMPVKHDGTPLPEFNEIQFRFDLTNGFSILNAWYSYSYINRNTRK